MIVSERPASLPPLPSAEHADPAVYGSRANAWYVLLLLFLALVVAFVDRMIISVLIEPLKHSLHLTDTDVSLLQGFAFVAFYALMTFPAAIVADRIGRKPVIIAGMVLWSLATIASAYSTTFTELFFWRLLVGAGQAALGIAGAPLLASVFPRQRLGVAIGIYSAGAAMGGGIALLVGGALLKLLAPPEFRDAIGLGAMEPWRATMLIAGFPGLLLSAAFLFAGEPQGTYFPGNRAAKAGSASLVAHLASRKYFYACLFVLVLGVSTYAYGVLVWGAPLLVRRYGVSPADGDIMFGLVMLTVGTLAAAAGGAIGDFVFTKGWRDAPVRLMTGFMALGAVGAAAIPFLPSLVSAIIGLCVLTFLLAASVPLPALAMQYLAPPHLRAQMVAVSGIFENVISGIIGPSMVAVVNDTVFRSPDAIHWSFASTLAVTGFVSVLFGWICMRRWQSDAEFRRVSAR